MNTPDTPMKPDFEEIIETVLDALDTLYLLEFNKGIITIPELQEQTRNLINTFAKSFESLLLQKEKEIKELEEDFEEMNQVCKDLNKEIERLQKTLSRYSNQEVKISNLNSEIERLKAEIKILEQFDER